MIDTPMTCLAIEQTAKSDGCTLKIELVMLRVVLDQTDVFE